MNLKSFDLYAIYAILIVVNSLQRVMTLGTGPLHLCSGPFILYRRDKCLYMINLS